MKLTDLSDKIKQMNEIVVFYMAIFASIVIGTVFTAISVLSVMGKFGLFGYILVVFEILISVLFLILLGINNNEKY